MFGIGLPELILILALALIVVGPDKLPDLARSVAKGILDLKKTASTLKDSLTEEGSPLADIKPELEKASKALTNEVMGVTSDTWTGDDRGSVYDQENTPENSPDIIDIEPDAKKPADHQTADKLDGNESEDGEKTAESLDASKDKPAATEQKG